MRIKRLTQVFTMFIFVICAFAFMSEKVEAKITTPENPIATCKNIHAIKLKWDKVDGASGYRIYRYSKKENKYKKIKTINGKNKTKWIDKKLKVHKIYKYKIASFSKRKTGKKISKKSYSISVRTYGRRGRVVNADSMDVELSVGNDIGICSVGKINTVIFGDTKVDRLNTKVVSKKIVWSSSDESIARVDQNGNIITFEKTGVCTIFMRMHNGKTKSYKLKVVNYANPNAFSYYDGQIPEINDLLKNYKKEICNIATFFTVYGEKGVCGTITVDESGSISGIPKLEKAAAIHDDLKKLMEDYKSLIDIYYNGKGYVEFRVYFGKSHYDVVYSEENTFETSPLRIAEHWLGRTHVVPEFDGKLTK